MAALVPAAPSQAQPHETAAPERSASYSHDTPWRAPPTCYKHQDASSGGSQHPHGSVGAAVLSVPLRQGAFGQGLTFGTHLHAGWRSPEAALG